MSARENLNRALLNLAESRQRPRCADYPIDSPWLSDEHTERAQAATWCTGCPVIDLCAAVGTEERHAFGVWGGIDRTRIARKAGAA